MRLKKILVSVSGVVFLNLNGLDCAYGGGGTVTKHHSLPPDISDLEHYFQEMKLKEEKVKQREMQCREKKCSERQRFSAPPELSAGRLSWLEGGPAGNSPIHSGELSQESCKSSDSSGPSSSSQGAESPSHSGSHEAIAIQALEPGLTFMPYLALALANVSEKEKKRASKNSVHDLPVLEAPASTHWRWQPAGESEFIVPVSADIVTNGSRWEPDSQTFSERVAPVVRHLMQPDIIKPSTCRDLHEFSFSNGSVVRLFGWEPVQSGRAVKAGTASPVLLYRSQKAFSNRATDSVWTRSLENSSAKPLAEHVRRYLLPLLGIYIGEIEGLLRVFFSQIHSEQVADDVVQKNTVEPLYIDCYFGDETMTVIISNKYDKVWSGRDKGEGKAISSLQLSYRFVESADSLAMIRCTGVHLKSDMSFVRANKGLSSIVSMANKSRTKRISLAPEWKNSMWPSNSRERAVCPIQRRYRCLPPGTLYSTNSSGSIASLSAGNSVWAESRLEIVPFGSEYLAVSCSDYGLSSSEALQVALDDEDYERLYVTSLRSHEGMIKLAGGMRAWYLPTVAKPAQRVSLLEPSNPQFESLLDEAITQANRVFATVGQVIPQTVYHSGEVSLRTYIELHSLLAEYSRMHQRARNWYGKALELYGEVKTLPQLEPAQLERLVNLVSLLVKEELNFRSVKSPVGTLARRLEQEVRSLSGTAGLIFLSRDYHFNVVLYYHKLVKKIFEAILKRGNIALEQVQEFLDLMKKTVDKDRHADVVQGVWRILKYGEELSEEQGFENFGQMIIDHFPPGKSHEEVLRVYTTIIAAVHAN